MKQVMAELRITCWKCGLSREKQCAAVQGASAMSDTERLWARGDVFLKTTLGDSSRIVVSIERYDHLLAELTDDQSDFGMDTRLATKPMSFPFLYFLRFFLL